MSQEAGSKERPLSEAITPLIIILCLYTSEDDELHLS